MQGEQLGEGAPNVSDAFLSEAMRPATQGVALHCGGGQTS